MKWEANGNLNLLGRKELGGGEQVRQGIEFVHFDSAVLLPSATEKMAAEFGDLCARGQVEQVREYLMDHPDYDINAWVDTDETALTRACTLGRTDVVLFLLGHPLINVNRKSSDGRTAFQRVCRQGRLEVVRELLADPRVDVNAYDRDGWSPAYCAAGKGHLDVIRWLIACGRKVDFCRSGRNWKGYKTPCEIARFWQHDQVASLLERFLFHEEETVFETRLTLGFNTEGAAALFAITVFLCDDYLRPLPSASQTSTSL